MTSCDVEIACYLVENKWTKYTTGIWWCGWYHRSENDRNTHYLLTLLSTNFIQQILKNSSYLTENTQNLHYKDLPLHDIIAIYSEIHTKHINTLSGKYYRRWHISIHWASQGKHQLKLSGTFMCFHKEHYNLFPFTIAWYRD